MEAAPNVCALIEVNTRFSFSNTWVSSYENEVRKLIPAWGKRLTDTLMTDRASRTLHNSEMKLLNIPIFCPRKHLLMLF
jgi:hypothetical protein